MTPNFALTLLQLCMNPEAPEFSRVAGAFLDKRRPVPVQRLRLSHVCSQAGLHKLPPPLLRSGHPLQKPHQSPLARA
jgi:hypothetical protein